MTRRREAIGSSFWPFSKKRIAFHRVRQRGQAQTNADLILGKDQLYDMFQQILNVKKFEHQLIYNALQVCFG